MKSRNSAFSSVEELLNPKNKIRFTNKVLPRDRCDRNILDWVTNPNDTMKHICSKYKIPQRNILPFFHYTPSNKGLREAAEDEANEHREKKLQQMSSLNRVSKRIANSRSESVDKSPKFKDTKSRDSISLTKDLVSNKTLNNYLSSMNTSTDNVRSKISINRMQKMKLNLSNTMK